MPDAFPEYVKCLIENQGLSIACLCDMSGLRYAQARAAKIGTLQARQLSLAEAAGLAFALGVSLDDLAQAARI